MHYGAHKLYRRSFHGCERGEHDGLCTVDAAATFTPMGWLVIAVLMQVGALGVLTFTSFFALFFSGRGSIYNQLLIRDFIY